MILQLTIFIVAGLGIVALLFHKYFEVYSGKKTFVSNLSDYTNTHVRSGVKVVRSVNMENAAKIFGWTLAQGIFLLKKMFIYIQNRSHSKKIVDIVSGKSVEKSTQGASVFLKRIKDHDRVDLL